MKKTWFWTNWVRVFLFQSLSAYACSPDWGHKSQELSFPGILYFFSALPASFLLVSWFRKFMVAYGLILKSMFLYHVSDMGSCKDNKIFKSSVFLSVSFFRFWSLSYDRNFLLLPLFSLVFTSETLLTSLMITFHSF